MRRDDRLFQLKTELVSYRMGDIFFLEYISPIFNFIDFSDGLYFWSCQNSSKWVVLVRSAFYSFTAVRIIMFPINKHLRNIDNSLGVLKGGHAIDAALRDTALIADSMGFDLVRTMSQREIISLARSQNAGEISKNELQSFVRADLIMEVVNGSEEVCYIAVEISFTVDERDTDRAIRNAKFLTQFTGKPAYAAVAGLDKDNRIQSSIEAGDVFWHQLDSEDLEVD